MTNGWMEGGRRGTTRDSLNLGNEGKREMEEGRGSNYYIH